MNQGGGDLRRITFDGKAAHNTDLAWSSDGRQVAFTHHPLNTGQHYLYEVHVADKNGNGRRSIAKGDNPSWSADGRRIAFSRRREERPSPDKVDVYYNIQVINLDGGGETPVPNPPVPWRLDAYVHWSRP